MWLCGPPVTEEGWTKDACTQWPGGVAGAAPPQEKRRFAMTHAVKLDEISVGAFTFSCRTCGLDNKGELVILLHGFPETSFMWEDMMRALAAEGYRCFAPDQRGYSKGARPLRATDYTVSELARDVTAFADQLGAKRFHVVGHDWGSNVAWAVAALHQNRVITTTNLSTYYPAEYEELVLNNVQQRKNIKYIFRYMKPDAPDHILANNKAYLRDLWSTHPVEHVVEYDRFFNDRETIAAILNLYIAKYMWLADPAVTAPREKYGDLYIPVLCIRGTEDPVHVPEAFDNAQKYMKGYYNYVQLQADHWLMEHNADYCIPAILRHIQAFPDK